LTDSLKTRLMAWQAAIDTKLRQAPFAVDPHYLYAPLRYALESHGKRLRPALLFCCAEVVGGDWHQAISAAAAVEIFHLFTLVHDDIMDKDDLRRGRPSLHRRFDTNRALLAGDALLIYAYQLLNELPEKITKSAIQIFNKYAFAVCEGQAWDMQYEHTNQLGLDDYDRMIDAKTGALLQLSAGLGSMVGNGTEAQAGVLTDMALMVGRAFQMQDDLLEVTSSSSAMGKSLGSDVVNGKKTWLWLDLWSHLGQPERDQWEQVKSDPRQTESAKLELIRRWMHESGTLTRARERISGWIEAANDKIDKSGFENTRILHALLEMILHRQS